MILVSLYWWFIQFLLSACGYGEGGEWKQAFRGEIRSAVDCFGLYFEQTPSQDPLDVSNLDDAWFSELPSEELKTIKEGSRHLPVFEVHGLWGRPPLAPQDRPLQVL